MRASMIMLICFTVPIGALYRFSQLVHYPIKTGITRLAPEGKYEARAYRFYSETFLGTPRIWYEFTIVETGTEKELAKEEIHLKKGVRAVRNKEKGSITWVGGTLARIRYESQEASLLVSGKVIRKDAEEKGRGEGIFLGEPPPKPATSARDGIRLDRPRNGGDR